MADPTKKRPIIRRRMEPITTRYTVPADAVNETLRVSGVAPELAALKLETVKDKTRTQEQKTKQLKARRDQYRARRQEQDRANGIIFSQPMSDEQVDIAMALEAASANQPQFRLGYSELEHLTRRNDGLLYTLEDMEQAKRLAELHNASFLGSMVAPSISPEMAERNPEYVNHVIRGDAGVLPYSFTSGLFFGTPSASAAFSNGVRLGWQTAGNIGTRVANATTQGAKAVVPIVTDPKYIVTVAAINTPTIADAYNFVTAGDGNSNSGNVAPILFTLGSIGAGYGAYRGFNTVRRAGWNLKALKPGSEGAAIRAASKTPKTTALIPYVGTYLRPDFFYSWWETPKKSAKAAGLPVPTRGLVWGARGRNALKAVGYGTAAGTIIDLGMSGASGHPFLWKLGYLPLKLPVDIATGAYNALERYYYPEEKAGTTQTADSVPLQSLLVANQVDTVVPVPRFDNDPVTTATKAELDSIENAWFNGEPIK